MKYILLTISIILSAAVASAQEVRLNGEQTAVISNAVNISPQYENRAYTESVFTYKPDDLKMSQTLELLGWIALSGGESIFVGSVLLGGGEPTAKGWSRALTVAGPMLMVWSIPLFITARNLEKKALSARLGRQRVGILLPQKSRPVAGVQPSLVISLNF